MSFSTDTTWPDGLLTIFDVCQREHPWVENPLYGPYNKLLTYCFGANSFEFVVTPLTPPRELSAHEAAEFTAVLVVFDVQRRPVLFAEIKDSGSTRKAALRFKATEQMRQRYDSMLGECPRSRLWGLSLLGTSLRVYSGDVATGDINPAFEDRPSFGHVLPYDFLEGAWDIDILSQAGFDAMKIIVRDITDGTAAL